MGGGQWEFSFGETKEWASSEVTLEEGVKNAFWWTDLAGGGGGGGGGVGGGGGGSDFGLF